MKAFKFLALAIAGVLAAGVCAISACGSSGEDLKDKMKITEFTAYKDVSGNPEKINVSCAGTYLMNFELTEQDEISKVMDAFYNSYYVRNEYRGEVPEGSNDSIELVYADGTKYNVFLFYIYKDNDWIYFESPDSTLSKVVNQLAAERYVAN